MQIKWLRIGTDLLFQIATPELLASDVNRAVFAIAEKH